LHLPPDTAIHNVDSQSARLVGRKRWSRTCSCMEARSIASRRPHLRRAWQRRYRRVRPLMSSQFIPSPVSILRRSLAVSPKRSPTLAMSRPTTLLLWSSSHATTRSTSWFLVLRPLLLPALSTTLLSTCLTSRASVPMRPLPVWKVARPSARTL
jgi:hypothetical protein